MNLPLKHVSLRMKAFIEENEKGDYLIHSPDKKINPWMEKVKYIYKNRRISTNINFEAMSHEEISLFKLKVHGIRT